MKYVKKPIVIEAIQYNGTNRDEILAKLGMPSIGEDFLDDHLYIETLEGDMKASIGDFIIKGVKGEFYPCKPDIFEESYDKFEIEDTDD
jgi:hypothetical protein